MQTAFNLRPFKPVDLDRVIQINRICLPENYSTLFFLDLYKRFPETFIVAEENNEVVGYILCRIETGVANFKLLGLSKKGHVISVAVLPKHHREGVGSTLIYQAITAMIKYKAKECYLEVRASNTPAVNLYKKMGFEIIRTIRGYYADGEAANVMATKLPI